jgi:pimeloyl-ACP methyl ester carboxylesterase
MIALPQVAGVRHDYVEANGLRFHVAEAGDRSAEPIVLLHGWPQHWYMWRHVIPRLAERYRVICPDLRGFGWSDAPSGGYEKETLVADMVAVMDAMGLDRVKLVGHDWGGYVGFLLALFHPDRVDRFLALCIVHPWPQANAGRLDMALRMTYQYVLASPAGPWLLKTQPSLVETALRSATRDKTTWSENELRAFSGVLQEPERAAASSALYRTFLLREAIPLATGRYDGYRLETPTLLLFARHDPAVPPSLAPGYETHADDMEVRVIEDAGHFIVDEKPEVVLAEAEAFFA